VAYDYAQDAQEVFSQIVNIGENQIVYNRELEGLALAFEYAAKVATPRQHQLGTSPQHLFLGHFHQNFDRNHQKPPHRHSISIPEAPQALVVGCSPAEVVLQRNFQLWCSQHRPHLILSDHHHLISPTPTPTLALPTLEAAQLHQFELFLLGFLVS
jgi:hypothetical protein